MSITPPVFPVPKDNASTTLAEDHTIGSGNLTVVSASSFGSPTTEAPLRITCQRQSDLARVHFLVTGISGNVMTIASVLDGYSDIDLAAGDKVGVLVSAGTILDLQSVDLELVSAVNILIDSDALKAPLASPTFTGSVTIDSLNGLVKASSGVLETATAGTDFLAPSGNGSGLTGLDASALATGTISTSVMPTTSVTPGSYTSTNLTVDSYGRITAAASGTSGGGTPGGSSGELQFNNSGSFGGTSNITTDGTALTFSGGTVLGNGSLVTSGSSFIVGQTGDEYGPSSLLLENRNGANGAVFSTVGASVALVDFGFTATAGLQANLRFENRSGSIDYGGNATHGAIQILMNSTGGGSSSQPFEIGELACIFYSPSVEYLSSFPGRIGVRTNDPLAAVHICTDSGTPCGIDQAASGQSADIRQFQNSSGTTLSGVDRNGSIYSGNSASGGRPTVTAIGATWFDTSLGIPIWWDGSHWINATGTSV